MASTLGRGLGSLLGEETVLESVKEKVREVDLEQIIPNKNQPRGVIDQKSLSELSDSIKEQGVLQPILVRQFGDRNSKKPRYELVAGERRWRASKLAGLSKIPVLVRDWNDDQSLEVAILENVQREELNPIDIARGYESLIRNFGYSHKKVGRQVGKSRVAVSNMLRLLNLPTEVLDLVAEGQLSMGHARALLGMEQGGEAVMHLARQIIDGGLSVRATEAIIRQMGDGSRVGEGAASGNEEVLADGDKAKEDISGKGRGGRRRDPVIVDMEARLREELKTGVSITCVNGRGKVILEFETPEMLEALAELLMV
ncbi:MAG: ParB/RepB/Spo0J family partition protein [Magnetococcales bacterium]|nr:ParB/RepB/Spo0J family partition protein [Magnetococcales bacterium]